MVLSDAKSLRSVASDLVMDPSTERPSTKWAESNVEHVSQMVHSDGRLTVPLIAYDLHASSQRLEDYH